MKTTAKGQSAGKTVSRRASEEETPGDPYAEKIRETGELLKQVRETGRYVTAVQLQGDEAIVLVEIYRAVLRREKRVVRMSEVMRELIRKNRPAVLTTEAERKDWNSIWKQPTRRPGFGPEPGVLRMRREAAKKALAA